MFSFRVSHGTSRRLATNEILEMFKTIMQSVLWVRQGYREAGVGDSASDSTGDNDNDSDSDSTGDSDNDSDSDSDSDSISTSDSDSDSDGLP